MAIFGTNVDSIIFTVLLAALPTIITRGRRMYESTTSKQPTIPLQQTRLLHGLTILVILHSVYIVYTILFNAPSNIFTALNAPLMSPTSSMRAKLSAHSLDGTLPPHTEALLTRLQSIDVRGYYVRFGHNAIQQCDYCHSFTDFGLFMMPFTGLQYMRTAVVMGLMTIPGSGKRSWRGWFIGALAVAGLLEGWILSSVQVIISQDGAGVPMWYDRAWYCRQSLFLLLPIALHMLPYQKNPYASLQSAPYAAQSVEGTLSSLFVLDAVRRASLRDDHLRKRVDEFYQHDVLTSRLAQRDEDIREEAERVGLTASEEEDGSPTLRVRGVTGLVAQWRTLLVTLLQAPPSPSVASVTVAPETSISQT